MDQAQCTKCSFFLFFIFQNSVDLMVQTYICDTCFLNSGFELRLSNYRIWPEVKFYEGYNTHTHTHKSPFSDSFCDETPRKLD